MNNYGARGLSYSELGRRSGMKSRSHPRDVVLGRKRLSLSSAQQICRGLKFPPDLRDFFLLLVENELAPLAAVDELMKARTKVQKRHAATARNSKDFYSLADATSVYASLGSLLDGVDLPIIQRKTRISQSRICTILNDLICKGFAREQEGRFFPTERHLSFSEIKAGGSFQKYYSSRTAGLRRRAVVNFDSQTELFWEATLSVRMRDLPRLKEELRTLLNGYVEDAESADGEILRSLTVGFFDPSVKG